MIEFKLPAIGEGVVEGEIVRWLKQPGDNVMANEPLVEVMTDKATVEIPSPQDAVVAEHKAPEGEIAAVGQVIAILSGDGASVAGACPWNKSSPGVRQRETARPVPAVRPPASLLRLSAERSAAASRGH